MGVESVGPACARSWTSATASAAPHVSHRRRTRARRQRVITHSADRRTSDPDNDLLAEARRKHVRRDALLERRVFRVQAHRALKKVVLDFQVLRVREAALDGANGLARLVVVEADALGTKLRIDDVDFLALADRLVRAFGLASAAVDAVGRDVRGHALGRSTPLSEGEARVESRNSISAFMHRGRRFAKGRAVNALRRFDAFSLLARVFVPLVFAFGLAGCTPAIGDACSYATECAANGTRTCDTTQPGGYCTLGNCDRGTCPAGSVCVLFEAQEPGCPTNDRATPRLARTYCMATCESTGDCRGSYTCAHPAALPWAGTVLDDHPTQAVCLASPMSSVDAGPSSDAGVAPVCSAAGPDVPPIDAPVRREDASAR